MIIVLSALPYIEKVFYAFHFMAHNRAMHIKSKWMGVKTKYIFNLNLSLSLSLSLFFSQVFVFFPKGIYVLQYVQFDFSLKRRCAKFMYIGYSYLITGFSRAYFLNSAI